MGGGSERKLNNQPVTIEANETTSVNEILAQELAEVTKELAAVRESLGETKGIINGTISPDNSPTVRLRTGAPGVEKYLSPTRRMFKPPHGGVSRSVRPHDLGLVKVRDRRDQEEVGHVIASHKKQGRFGHAVTALVTAAVIAIGSA